jgi:hypothetical protein
VLSYSLIQPESNAMVVRSNIRAIFKCVYLWKANPMIESEAKALIRAVLNVAKTAADLETKIAAMAVMVELVELYYYYLPEFLDSICEVISWSRMEMLIF